MEYQFILFKIFWLEKFVLLNIKILISVLSLQVLKVFGKQFCDQRLTIACIQLNVQSC
jgi:hypothetical protein